MLATAAGFAVLSALSPTAVLVGAVYLGSASPRRTTLLYLAGAVTTTVIMGIIVLLALKAGHLNLPANQQPRYGLRLGLGVVALAGGLYMTRRKPKPPDPAKPKKPGLVSRMMTRPEPLFAFATGVFVFFPSAAFVAAVQVIATSNAGDLAIALTLLTVIVIDVILIWLPFLFYLAAPDLTTRTLKRFNAWLRAHGHAIVAGALLVVGGLLILNGITGLT
ncbi:MAG TPA: GAP family protein [Streptosporangiaceae bacterium]|jgi:hypothetical protein|nr:GAP family protein [Streptosporangiaceae bacterium]